MIRCHIDKEKGPTELEIKGTGDTINTELLALIGEIYRGIKSQSKPSAAVFRVTTIAALLDPTSPVWEED